MRVHSLRFAALGPFAGEVVIDFDALGSSALFLIDGPTGSGKSTIIDALVFALYGDVAGEASDKERLRSAFASPETESFAEVDFSTMAGRFRVRRTPAYERAKKRGTGTTPESATVQVWRSVGEQTWEPLSTKHAEADAEIARAVGLTRVQFLQTVVLPQGEFATFLRSESADRLPILERIFATEVYSRIQAEFDEERRAAMRAREASRQGLQSARDVLRGQLEGTALTIDEVHDATGWAAERDALLLALRAQLDTATAATAACDADLAGTTARLEALVASEQAAKAEASAREAISRAEARVEELQAQIGPGEGESLESAIALLDSEIEWCAAEAAVEASLPALEQQSAAALARVEEIDASIRALERERDEVIPGRMAAYVAGLRDEVRVAEESVAAQERRVRELRDARVRGLSGEIALTLGEGDACPVCGSLEHPAPASVDADHVSAELVTEQEQQLDAHRGDLESLRTAAAVITASLPVVPESAEPVSESRARILDSLQSDIEALGGIGARMEESRASRAAALSARDELESRITADRARTVAAREDFDTVAERAESLRSRRTTLVSLREAHALLEQARAHLDSVVVGESPDQHDAAALEAARSARDQASAAARRATAEMTAASRLLGAVGELCAAVDAAQAAHEKVERESAATIRLAQALTGASGQSLSAYVVQRAFDEVVEAANARLASMLGGHFRLITTQERTGSRRTGLGLGLKVRDLRTDTERRTTTLSGGESFCASLALALGLADSVRAHAGGVEIGMLLIDEGFGALDIERLGDVMAELLRLRADGRSVGVISHVTEMKRAIPERIDVQPGPGGSTVSVRWMA